MLQMEMITDKMFDSMVLQSEIPALVFLSADWSGASFLTELAIGKVHKSLKSDITYYKIELSESIVELGDNKVTLFEVPTLLLYKNGEMLFRHNGILNKEKLLGLIEEKLN